MMPYQSYQLYEVERPKSIAERRAADVRRGELAAAISRPIRAAGAQLRAVKAAPRRTFRDARPAFRDETLIGAGARSGGHGAPQADAVDVGLGDQAARLELAQVGKHLADCGLPLE